MKELPYLIATQSWGLAETSSAYINVIKNNAQSLSMYEIKCVLLSSNEYQFIFQFVNPKAQFIKGTMTSLNAALTV